MQSYSVMFSRLLQIVLHVICLVCLIECGQKCDPSRFSRATITYTENSPPVRRIVISKYGINPLRYAETIEVFTQPIDHICSNTFYKLFNLKKLSITGCDLTYLEPGAFEELPVFELLDLSFNKLTEIEGLVFEKLSLSTIYLVHNEISKISKDAFKGLENLKQLHLQYNKLKVIEGGIFNGLVATTLRLDHNEISYIDEDAFDDMQVSQLYLNSNKLKHYMPAWFKNCDNFGVLNLANNKMTFIPTHAFKNLNKTRYLVDIRLDDNNLWSIHPEAFAKGPKYRFVTLSHNNISEIAENAFIGTSAGDINLEFNRLTCLPENLRNILVATHMHYLDNNPWTDQCKRVLIDYARKKKIQIHISDAFI